MELTPRTGPDGSPDAPRRRRRRMSLPALALLVAVIAIGGFVVLQALGSATTFYRNVDEAVAQRDALGVKRFRLQGTVVPGTIDRTGEGVTFEVAYNGVGVMVRHVGDPPEMFKESEAVLLEGRFDATDGKTFDSDLMIIKHSEVYKEKEAGRLSEADVNGKVPVTSGGGGS
ncbi:MAG: cytochrome c maturation protein CcmE [Acidimicrobiia bacterium]|nr:cytochrome c maturation protein CcmE [Acidimicrobiia bacterium]